MGALILIKTSPYIFSSILPLTPSFDFCPRFSNFALNANSKKIYIRDNKEKLIQINTNSSGDRYENSAKYLVGNQLAAVWTSVANTTLSTKLLLVDTDEDAFVAFMCESRIGSLSPPFTPCLHQIRKSASKFQEATIQLKLKN